MLTIATGAPTFSVVVLPGAPPELEVYSEFSVVVLPVVPPVPVVYSESGASLAAAATATVEADVAVTQASNASTSATNAAFSASNAATSATNAAFAASEAISAEAGAASSAAAALASWWSAAAKWLGASLSDPTADAAGNALADGALYWSSAISRLKVRAAGVWTAAYNTVFQTSGQPSGSTGIAGDIAIDPTAAKLYANVAGTWNSGLSLAGPTGATGAPGPPGSMQVYTVMFSGVEAGQSVALPGVLGMFALLVVNGRVEFPGNYAVSDTTLIIPPGLVWDSAPCMFLFSPPTSGTTTATAPVTEEFEITTAGQSFTFASNIGSPMSLYLDGLRQSASSFSVAGATITLASDIDRGNALFEFSPLS